MRVTLTGMTRDISALSYREQKAAKETYKSLQKAVNDAKTALDAWGIMDSRRCTSLTQACSGKTPVAAACARNVWETSEARADDALDSLRSALVESEKARDTFLAQFPA